MPVTLYKNEPDLAAKLLNDQLVKGDGNLEVSDLLRNVQAQVLLDRLNWLGEEVLKQGGCPRCSPDKVAGGPERITPSFIDHISLKLLDTNFLVQHTAHNLI